MRQTNASAAVQEQLLDVALANERLTQTRARSPQSQLTWTAIATLAVVVVILLTVNEVFYWTLRAEIQRKRLAPANPVLLGTLARDRALLSQYRWVKQSDGILRIPVERARKLVVADYARAAAAASVSSAASAASQGAGP